MPIAATISDPVREAVLARNVPVCPLPWSAPAPPTDSPRSLREILRSRPATTRVTGLLLIRTQPAPGPRHLIRSGCCVTPRMTVRVGQSPRAERAFNYLQIVGRRPWTIGANRGLGEEPGRQQNEEAPSNPAGARALPWAAYGRTHR